MSKKEIMATQKFAILDMARESGINFKNAGQIAVRYFCCIAVARLVFDAL